MQGRSWFPPAAPCTAMMIRAHADGRGNWHLEAGAWIQGKPDQWGGAYVVKSRCGRCARRQPVAANPSPRHLLASEGQAAVITGIASLLHTGSSQPVCRCLSTSDGLRCQATRSNMWRSLVIRARRVEAIGAGLLMNRTEWIPRPCTPHAVRSCRLSLPRPSKAGHNSQKVPLRNRTKCLFNVCGNFHHCSWQ